MNRLLALFLLTLLVSCSQKEQQKEPPPLTAQEKAYVEKFSERVAYLESERNKFTNRIANTRQAWNTAVSNSQAEIAAELWKQLEKMEAAHDTVLREKWETEMRQMEFLITRDKRN
jgi:DNA anti-recombination protein RmuC